MMKKINLKYLLIAICAIQLIAILFLLDYSLEKEIVYVPGKTKTITLSAGNQAVYSVNQKKYNDKPTKEIKKIIKEIPDLKSSKVIALTETNSQLQLKLGEKDLVINDLRFNFEIFPCEELSGDYVNYFSIDDENIGFYIMDVSGHGVAAAMLGVFAAQSIGESMRIKYKEASIFSPAAVLNHFYSLTLIN